MEKSTQAQKIKQHLESGGTITALSAFEKYGCMRLAARISDLRNQDKMPIASRTIKKGEKRFSEYYLQLNFNTI